MSLHPHYAVCDVGTNSVRLMLADEALRPLYKTLVTTRIGDELATTSRLSEGGMARTLTALSEYRYAAEEYNLPLWAFATSAVRDAENKEEFLARCEDRGLFLEVVSGETEGMLGFLGVGAPGPARLVDIGGGSTEIACGADGLVHRSFSAPVGCVRALTCFGFAPDGPQKVRRWLRETMVTVEGERLPMALAMERTDPAAPVYAVSGTATSLASFAAGATNAYRAEAVNGLLLSKKKIEEILAELSALTPQERCAIPVLSERGDLILYGGALLLECMECLGATTVTVSDADNLEGYLRARVRGLL